MGCNRKRDALLLAQRMRRGATTCLPKFLGVRVESGEALNHLGIEFLEAGMATEASVVLQRAQGLMPASAEVHNNLGLSLAEQARYCEARVCYEMALRINPRLADVHANLGNCYREQGYFVEAMECYEQALAVDPQSLSARCCRALAFLQSGDFEKGWLDYECRFAFEREAQRPFSQPRWDGCDAKGRAILLWNEHGIGDMLQFIRYAGLLKERGASVVVYCPAPLVPLISRIPFAERVVPVGTQLPKCDFHIPLMSLPRLLKTTLPTVPAPVPYLFPAAHLVAQWRQRLSHDSHLRIGIAWQGNPAYKKDQHRSIPLARFAPLASLEGVQLYSLQKGSGVEQLASIAKEFSVVDFGEALDTKSGAFMDTAAIMKNLDLVITSDTSIAHLAGALGVRVWVALSAVADWRWLLDREDSPWYPTMRLFRQSRLGDWTTVFERMASEVQKLLRAERGPRAIAIEISPGELLDRITILRIKAARITDADKLQSVQAELDTLVATRERLIPAGEDLENFTRSLQDINAKLWDTENDLRMSEGKGVFGPQFTERARSVYRLNDQRAALKRQIDAWLGARVGEQKCYPAYG